jgi:hypothetical protein
MDTELNRSSVTAANMVFTHRPHIKLTAIRDNLTGYTIVRRGEVPSNFLFAPPIVITPPRINIRELRDRIATRLQSMDDADDDLVDFINQTLVAHRPRSNPLTREVLDSLREATLEGGSQYLSDQCSICQDNFTVGDTVIVLECGHVNHSSCLHEWFTEHNTCTHCRYVPGTQN